MLSAVELHQRGLEASNAGRHATARKAFQQALSRAENNETRARIELSLAYTEAELGTIDDGLARCGRALDLPDVPDLVRGLIWSQLGLLHMRAGDGATALADLERAAPLIDPEAHRALGNLYLTLGNIHLQRSAPDAAIASFEASSEHYVAVHLTHQSDKALHNLGYAYLLAGDVVRAIQLMDQARPTFQELGPVYEAVGSQDRAEALVAAGMPHDAADALRAAASAFARRRMRKRQAEALLVLARLLLREDPREARRVARQAMRLFTGNGSQVWAVRARAVALEAEVLTGRRRTALSQESAEVAALLREQGLVHDATALELQSVRLAIRAGDPEAALERLARIEESEDAPLSNRILASQVRAESARAAGDVEAALDSARHGLTELHAWQSAFGSLDLQSSLVGHGRDLAMHGLRTAVQDGTPQVVFEWAERARALATRVAPVRPTVGSQHAEQLRRLRKLTLELDKAATTGQPAPSLASETRELRRKIREEAWHDEGSGVITEPASLAQLQARLEDRDGVLLAHVVMDGRMHALVVTRTDARVLDLGRFDDVRHLLRGLQADLDVSAAHLPEQLRAVVIGSLDHRLSAMADRLIAPVADLLKDRPIVLVPSGSLAGVPWTLLRGLQGTPVTLPRSATLWLEHADTATRPRHAALVSGPLVARAEEEVVRSAAAWQDATVLTGSEASTERVAGVAARADVLHVAAHGRHSADNPLFSGLELHDGLWFGYDIDRLGHVPDIVLLSACEVGRSAVRWGEEAIGMPAAWLHAGSRVVIASPASVDDDVACEVLSSTHQLLARGVLPSDALAEATTRIGMQVPSTFMCFGAGW
ncbi:CHAT domain-containing protein [Leekyejoonella antrihumi]|uniref:CHAT domain-containing protein n=1 Tax=Leekyejoonella antrihumi TaxID=1660198 RepID=A0A563E9U4_9MICO|nr:CHAT domain-containing protein [Leekyejoonella antrihumi]TWP38981.1 CHAT domain-containing protein [Leekyejoonella antrihumi]